MVERAREVPIIQYETAGAARLKDELVPRVHALVADTLETLERIPGSGEDEAPGGPGAGDPLDETSSFLRQVDRLVAHRQAADIAFIGGSELRSKLGGLESVSGQDDPWLLLDRAGSTLRKVVKIATALHVVLADSEGALSFETELRVSLQVRAAYAKFRRRLKGSLSQATTTRRRAQTAATCIAYLVGRDTYPQLRIGDRLALRQLQARILAWLRDREAEAKEGERICQDLLGFAELVRNVNLRSELVGHDQALIARLLDDGPKALAARGHAELEKLAGLDDELDELLAAGAPPGAILTALEHLRSRLPVPTW